LRITLSRNATCGKVTLEKGEYWVALQAEASQIQLLAGGRTFKVPAVRRRAKVRGKTVQVSFYSGGGPQWSLVVADPKMGEWIALIEYARE
jgi:hypothetical protein